MTNYFLEDPISGEIVNFKNLREARKTILEKYGVELEKQDKNLYSAYFWHSGRKEGYILYLTRVRG